MTKRRVLVTGCKGLLGTALTRILSQEYEVIPCDIDTADVTDLDSFGEFARNASPDIIVHCAGYTRVDDAEKEKELAFKINAFGTKNVATVATEMEAPVLYVSTDYVFDGRKGAPYLEFDRPNPINVYGSSKLAGEDFVRNICPQNWIVRTSWLYGTGGKNFVDTMVTLSGKGKEIPVVDDQRGSPTLADDLAGAMMVILKRNEFGLYHATNGGDCSWYEFAREIVSLWGGDAAIVKPISSAQSDRPAKRPTNSVLENYRLRHTLGFETRHWRDALKDYLRAKKEEGS
ncbi:MAG: dTDP-4-dehydrorhamnose reductase [Candidatus Eisenbacteria bacterium]|nr:dTDP-4-dehydrorhamnose reductase [Candidatus Eisenbacteria bacterium]